MKLHHWINQHNTDPWRSALVCGKGWFGKLWFCLNTSPPPLLDFSRFVVSAAHGLSWFPMLPFKLFSPHFRKSRANQECELVNFSTVDRHRPCVALTWEMEPVRFVVATEAGERMRKARGVGVGVGFWEGT